MAEIAIILPACNEADRLEHAVDRTIERIEQITDSYEIILAEDGSDDGTDRIAEYLTKKYPSVKHMHSDEREGRGKAIKKAIQAADAEIIVYYDLDLSTDLSCLGSLIDAIKDHNDIATGSRLLQARDMERSVLRDVASRAYNLMIRLLLKSNVRDHQCGFKAFRKSAVLPLLDAVKDNHWFWDTELLVVAQRNHLRIREVPVKWTRSGSSTVKLARDSIYMGIKALEFWLKYTTIPLYIALLVSVAILSVILIYSGVSNVLEVIVTAEWPYIALAFAVYLASWPVRGWRYKKILQYITKRDLSTCFVTGTIAISQTSNLLVPARIGDLARVYILNKIRHISYTNGISALVIERLFDIVAILSISILSLVFLLSVKLPDWIVSLVLVFGSLIALVMIMLLLFRVKRSNFISNVLEEVRAVSLSPGFSAYILAFSLAIWAIDALTCYVVTAAFHMTVPLSLILLAVMVGNIVKTLPVTPGGIGTYEAAVMGVLLLSISPAPAFSIALLDHLVKNLSTACLGVLFTVLLGADLDGIRQIRRTADG